MRKVLPMSRIREMEPYMDAKVLDYIHEGQIEAFEGFEDFDLIAFDWYDVRSERTAASQMLLYLDREDLFVFCEDDAAEDAAQAALLVPEEEALSNEQVLHRFFVRLLRGDMAHLDRLEADISDGETEVLTGAHEAYLDRIIAWRQELLRLKRYYEQLDSIFDELAENDNSLLGKQNTRRFANLGNRMERYLNAVQSLRESVAQLREAYQSQLSIQQNDLMKIFTVVTAVFLPLTLLGLGPEHQAAVIETGMNHFGEIRYLGEMVRPDIAVISNIGDAHIEHLGSREGILKAKSEIFENLKPEGLAVLNGDDALLNTLDLPFRTVRCGRSEHCAVRVMDMADHGVAGITCTVVSPRDTYHLTIPAPGEHMAYSAAIAVAVGEELGLSTEEITRGAASYEPAGSRMRVLRLRDGRLVLDDCYNANPQSVTAALEILAKTECGRKVAVLGDMGELGDLTDQAHYNMGALAAMLGIDEVVAIGAKAEKIADGAAQSGGSVTHFATKEEAVHELTDQLGTDTAMLVKASHAMHFGWIVEQLKQAYD